MPVAVAIVAAALVLPGCYLWHDRDGAGRGRPRDSAIEPDGGGGPLLDASAIPRDGAVAPSDARSAGGDATRTLPDGGPRPGLDGAVGDRGGEIWDGYVEMYSFPSGCDDVRIVFDSAPPGDGPRTGVVIFGCGMPPPPVTNPEVGYPIADPPIQVYEGFEYPIVEGRVSRAATRIEVSVDWGSVWAEWCALQLPVPLETRPGWGCLPEASMNSGPDGCVLFTPTGDLWVDCGKMAICSNGICECTEERCAVRSPSPWSSSLDFSVMGDTGDGTSSFDGRRIRMRRTR